jgi:hypothetical protein
LIAVKKRITANTFFNNSLSSFKAILKAYNAEGQKEMEQEEALKAERKDRGYYDRERRRD